MTITELLIGAAIAAAALTPQPVNGWYIPADLAKGTVSVVAYKGDSDYTLLPLWVDFDCTIAGQFSLHNDHGGVSVDLPIDDACDLLIEAGGIVEDWRIDRVGAGMTVAVSGGG